MTYFVVLAEYQVTAIAITVCYVSNLAQKCQTGGIPRTLRVAFVSSHGLRTASACVYKGLHAASGPRVWHACFKIKGIWLLMLWDRNSCQLLLQQSGFQRKCIVSVKVLPFSSHYACVLCRSPVTCLYLVVSVRDGFWDPWLSAFCTFDL